MAKDHLPRQVYVFVQLQADPGRAQQARELALADLDGLAAQVLAVDLPAGRRRAPAHREDLAGGRLKEAYSRRVSVKNVRVAAPWASD